MRKRHLVFLTAALAAPLAAHAQPRLRDRPIGDQARPSPGTAAAAGATGGAGATATPTTAPPAAAPASPPSTTTPGTTTPSVGASGKAQADTASLAQFENALEFEPRPANYKVAFSLEDADLAELVRVISQLTGKRFIFGGKVKNIKASVYSPQKVTVAEAYQAFLSILEANKLTVVPHGRFLKIVDTDGVQTNGTPIYGALQGSPEDKKT